MTKHLAIANHVATIRDGQRFLLAMVGNKNRDAIIAQASDNILNAVDRYRINAREWLI